MSIGLLILGIFLFIMLVVLHEWGHFMVARRNKVGVEEFGIFFPPKIWSTKTKKGWIFSINLLPLGGFVRLKGEHDADKRPGSFGAAPTISKVKIMLAGIGMNLVVAFVLLTILGWVGIPQLVSNQFSVKSNATTSENEVVVGSVVAHSPAYQLGIKEGDKLLSIASLGGKSVPFISTNDISTLTKKYASQVVKIDFSHNGQAKSGIVKLRSDAVVNASLKTNNPEGYLGVNNPISYSLVRYTWSAPVVALGLMVQFTVLTFQGLGHIITGLFTGHASQSASQLTGPLGIFAILQNRSLLGYQFVLMIMAVISLSLAIINVLPIPPLDGGKLYITLVYRALKRQISEKAENIIYGSSFALIFLLFIIITYNDYRHFY